MSPQEFTKVCRGYAERRRHLTETAWLTAKFVGDLLSKDGLRPLDELENGGRQSPAQFDVMLNIFSHQVKAQQERAALN